MQPSELMLPNSNHVIPIGPQPTGNPEISLAVCFEFRLPEADSSLRNSTTLWASVPKTTIDEERETEVREIEIGPSCNVAWMLYPAADLLPSERGFHFRLGGRIRSGSNPRHLR